MFGYIITNPESLPKERQERFRAVYCGVCRALRREYGIVGSAALSFDMAFMALLLNALYEPGDTQRMERCAVHPIKPHAYVDSPVMGYAAAMNLALAYHKCMDDWLDDKNAVSLAEAKALKRAYGKVAKAHPDKCRVIEAWLDEIHAMEREGLNDIDPPVNATGRMLGELFLWKETDAWAESVRGVGDGLGRFIYLMDAYEDLPADVRRRRYNPLKDYQSRPDYEDMCRTALMMMAADATDAFEMLPIVQDADILRNILYSGIWSKYAAIQKKRNPTKKE